MGDPDHDEDEIELPTDGYKGVQRSPGVTSLARDAHGYMFFLGRTGLTPRKQYR